MFNVFLNILFFFFLSILKVLVVMKLSSVAYNKKGYL